MRLLVVDDDFSVANGIVTHLPWDKLKIDEVTAVNSAGEAREAFRNGNFEIVLCDIEMPVESGISLVEWIRENYPSVLCIFLTAHAEFEYAQKGVQLGCFDYILQPTTYENIEEVLRRAVNQVNIDRYKKELQQLALDVRNNEQTMIRHMLREYLYGEGENAEAQIAQLGNFGCHLEEMKEFTLLRIQIFAGAQDELPDRDVRAFIIQNVISEMIPNKNMTVVSAALSRAENLVLLPDFSLLPVRFEEIMEEFRKTIARVFHYKTALYVLVDTEHGLPMLREASRRISAAASDNVQEADQVFWIEQNGEREEQMFGETWGRGKLIRNTMRFNFARWQQLFNSGYYDIVETEISTYLTDVLSGDIGLNELVEFHELFSQMILLIMYKADINVFDFFTEIKLPYQVFMDSYYSINQLRETCLFVIKCLRSQHNLNKDYEDEISRARTYILDHILEDLSVQEVADYVHFSPEYLTKMFRRTFGKNVKEYILDEKFAIAKDRLKNTRLSVSTIGADIGYTNLSHFITIFKKKEGMTPNEYRKSLNMD